MLKHTKYIKRRISTLKQAYTSYIEKHNFKPDALQLNLVEKLQNLQDRIANQSSSSLFRIFKQTTPKGLYIFGPVGCGKTFLMKLFYETLQTEQKTKIHFLEFMSNIHKALHNKKLLHPSLTQDEILDILTLDITKNKVLCLDELQVLDIADAMIIRVLFKKLWANNLVLVATSNRPPQDLYQNGLQRSSFVPFIQQLTDNCDIFNMQSSIDYRRQAYNASLNRFLIPNSITNNQILKESFLKRCNNEKPENLNIQLLGRSVRIKQYLAKSAFFDFGELCLTNSSANDYLALAQVVQVFYISNIPKFTAQTKDAARRFITLIDALYENNCQLFCSMAAKEDLLFTNLKPSTNNHGEYMDDFKAASVMTNEEELFASQRCVSRLKEMQSMIKV